MKSNVWDVVLNKITLRLIALLSAVALAALAGWIWLAIKLMRPPAGLRSQTDAQFQAGVEKRLQEEDQLIAMMKAAQTAEDTRLEERDGLMRTQLLVQGGITPGKAGIDWITIPGGSFVMGSNDRHSEEKPAHRVRVKTFQLARTEVTFAQYQKCVEAGACIPPHVSDGSCFIFNGFAYTWKRGNLARPFLGDRQPVVCVDWEQARAFSEWVGGRLPTEAEWEYAARSAGKDRSYPWGNENPTCSRVVMEEEVLGCGRRSTWPVCSRPAGNTEQGICDMSGNVGEWVHDHYHDSYDGAPRDGTPWVSLLGSFRNVRGGSWANDGYVQSVSSRSGGFVPGSRFDLLGFRPARPSR